MNLSYVQKGRWVLDEQGWIVGNWSRSKRTRMHKFYPAEKLRICTYCQRVGWDTVRPRSAGGYTGYDGWEKLENPLCDRCFWRVSRGFLRVIKKDEREDEEYHSLKSLVDRFRAVMRAPLHKRQEIAIAKFGERI